MTERTQETQLVTRSGLQLTVRPVRPDDRERLRSFFAGVSGDDLRFRFLTGLVHVSDEHIATLVDVDHKQTEDFLAFTDDGALVASAMIASDPALERAEVAIAVREDCKNLGIGWCLLDHVAGYARDLGIKVLEAVESRQNHQAIEVERDYGFSVAPYEGDATLVVVRKQLA